MRYCESVGVTRRWKTREVKVGSVGVGGANPVRIQSMTTSDTRDVAATVEQVMRLADAGCELVRMTVQGIKEADACEAIKNSLVQQGYNVPLIADIHFYPPAAMRVVDFVDKVRVNPGNFVDKRASFKVLEYDDATYAQELQKIEDKFGPLVEKCKSLGRAMRIGTNHGSLSDRVMNRFGDSPRGMVESALEFARIARKLDFHDLVFSMKSSNPRIMIQAYRLLVAEMRKLGWNYPLHLGVTEAGQGQDGRIKSSMGIGALLLDGLGDTVRVSLTEDPWYEVDPCRRLVSFSESIQGLGVGDFAERHRDISKIEKRPTNISPAAPLHRNGSVLLPVGETEILGDSFFEDIGCELSPEGLSKTETAADAVVISDVIGSAAALNKLSELVNVGVGVICPFYLEGAVQLQTLSQAHNETLLADRVAPYSIPVDAKKMTAVLIQDEGPKAWEAPTALDPALVIFMPSKDPVHRARLFFDWIQSRKLKTPVILAADYSCGTEDLPIHASAELGSLLCDGFGEGVMIRSEQPLGQLRELEFNILQAARMRASKTEFISCPSCGRTLFDLQETSERIRQRTGHLPGVKIAVMGCIVNGPGEMADADFGYVGSRAGKIDLYVGKDCVEKNIDAADADDRLIDLIKTHGRWLEKTHA